MRLERVAWVDYAKGVCIIFVVMMHCVSNYSHLVEATGWLQNLVDFALPFRMPDFFLISGLFLGLSIHEPLIDYIDRKVLHFAYFYVLWLTIQLPIVDFNILAANPSAFGLHYLTALVEPTNTLWFVHMLAVFYIFTRLVRNLPKWLVFIFAVGLQTAYQLDLIDTGWTVADRFAQRYVYFFVGYACAPMIFDFARKIGKRPAIALVSLTAWAFVNGATVHAGFHEAPGISLALGLAGAAAIVSFGALMAGRGWAKPLRHAGANSIVVYLTFVFPMHAMMRLLAETQLVPDVGTATCVITIVAVAAPLVFHWLIRNTPLNFLYVRPAVFHLTTESARGERAASVP